MLPCSTSSSKTSPTWFCNLFMTSALRAASPISSVTLDSPLFWNYKKFICSDRHQRRSATPISRSIIPANSRGKTESFDLQLETVKQCQSMDSLLVLSNRLTNQDLDLRTTSLLRQAATLARLQKGHGTDTDSKRDLMALLVPASMKSIKVLGNKMLYTGGWWPPLMQINRSLYPAVPSTPLNLSHFWRVTYQNIISLLTLGSPPESAYCPLITPTDRPCSRQAMSWSDLSTHLWAWAVLSHHPGEAWIEAALERGSRSLGFMPEAAPAAHVSVALWALYRLGVRPRKRWVKKCRKVRCNPVILIIIFSSSIPDIIYMTGRSPDKNLKRFHPYLYPNYHSEAPSCVSLRLWLHTHTTISMEP